MTRRERVLCILSVAIARSAKDEKLLTGAQQTFRQNKILGYMPAGYDRKSLYALLSRMERDGVVQKSKLTGKTTLLVTPTGVDALCGEYGHVGVLEKSWDKQWRIVIYDVPEKDRYKREKIRLALLKLGYGMFQKSIYISPFDVASATRTYLAQEGLLEMATVLTAASDELGSARSLSERVFHLSVLREQYLGFLRRLQFVVGQQLPEKREQGLRRIRAEFVNLLSQDPFLPRELLPADWPFFRVRAELSNAK